MSYILEALRRAETERERKRRVPGLHAQPVPAASLEERAVRRSGRVWLWIALGVSAGVLLPLLWRWWVIDPIAAEAAAAARTPSAGSVTPQSAVDAPTTPAVASAPIATPPAAAPPTPEPVPQTPHSPRATHPPAKTTAAAKANATTGERTRERGPAAAAQPPAHALKPAASAPLAATAAVAPVPASAPEPKLRGLNEMPEDIRRSVPTLSFGGSVYSEIAAQRMVIFNGQVLREGDAVSDEVTLEQIRPRSAVMRVRGQRFEITF